MKKIKNENFLRWLRTQPCCIQSQGRVCGYQYTEPHHLGDNVHTRRGNDTVCIPICREHHISIHNHPELHDIDALRILAAKYFREFQGVKMKTFISVTDSFSLKSSKIPPLKPVTWRKCHKCGKKKEIRLFPVQLKNGIGGHTNICRSCMREMQK